MTSIKIPRSQVWVVLPAYNEQSAIDSVIQRIKNCGYSNILVIDDGSSDQTFRTALSSGVSGLQCSLNRGVGSAVQLALHFAKSSEIEYLVFLDADGQHYPEDIDLLRNEMEKAGSDLIIGSRFLSSNKSIPYLRRFYNKIANLLTLMGKIIVTDSQSGFRMLNKKAISSLNLEIDGYGVCTEMLWKAIKSDLLIKEVPIRVLYTEYSLSKGQNFITGMKTGLNLIKKLLH